MKNFAKILAGGIAVMMVMGSASAVGAETTDGEKARIRFMVNGFAEELEIYVWVYQNSCKISDCLIYNRKWYDDSFKGFYI